MARTITVVLSQSNAASPSRRELESGIVAELLMVQGADVTVIPHLELLDHDDTGLVCLEGMTGDLVLLTWIDSVQAHELLAAKGITGRRGLTRLSTVGVAASKSSEPTRTIYHIDLRQLDSVTAGCAEIQRIRDEAAVQTVHVHSSLGEFAIDQARPKPTDLSDSKLRGPDPQSIAAADEPRSPTEVTGRGIEPSDGAAPIDDDPDLKDDASLDRLIEQLDDWDG